MDVPLRRHTSAEVCQAWVAGEGGGGGWKKEMGRTSSEVPCGVVTGWIKHLDMSKVLKVLKVLTYGFGAGSCYNLLIRRKYAQQQMSFSQLRCESAS